MLRLLRTKACKRCGGDLSLERDEYGAYVECIQCGAVSNEVQLIYRAHSAGEHQAAPIGKDNSNEDSR